MKRLKNIFIRIHNFFIELATAYAIRLIKDEIQRAEQEDEINTKYKVVIKKNWLGFKSYEYHQK